MQITPFDPSTQKEFINIHIAHRLTALLSPIRRQQIDPTFFSGCGDVFCASIEGSFIMLRVFIEFLGVESKSKDGKVFLVQRTRTKGKQKAARNTDVMLDSFNLPLAVPDDFHPHQDLIARVHDGLSKSTAHFTYQANHFFDADRDFLLAVNCVLTVLQKRFFALLSAQPIAHEDLPKLNCDAL